MAVGYVPLPAFRAAPGIDFGGLNEGLDALGKTIERNRLLAEQKEIGAALQGGQSSSAPAQNRLLGTSSSPAQYGAANATDFIKQQEGFTPAATWDRRQYSSGYGTKAAPGETVDRATAEQRLSAEVAPIDAWISQNIKVPLTPEQRTGLTSFAYNLGTDDLQRLSGDINAGNWDRVAQRMPTFNKALNNQTGQLEVVDGLTNRRMREAALVRGGGGAPAQSSGPNYDAAARVAFGQGNLDAGLRLTDAQRANELEAYNRSRQGRLDSRQEEAIQREIDNTAYERSRQGRLDTRQESLTAYEQARQGRLDTRAEATEGQQSELRGMQITQARQQLETAAQTRLAGIAQVISTQTDPAQKAAMWQRFVQSSPKIASTLQNYGIDPRDAEAGSAFLVAEARGLTEPKPAEFKSFKADEGIYRAGPGGLQVIREPGGSGTASSGLDPVAEKERQKVFGKGVGEAQVTLPTALNAGEAVLRSIDAARTDPAISRVTGPIQSWLPNLTETAARAQSRVDQLQGQTFLQAFQALKGGGTITEQEGAKAQAALNRLGSLGMGDADYLKALDEFRGEVLTLYDLAQQKAGVPPEQRRQLPQLNAQPTPPAGAVNTVRVNTPEEAMRLPSGTQFMTPDGRVKVRP